MHSYTRDIVSNNHFIGILDGVAVYENDDDNFIENWERKQILFEQNEFTVFSSVITATTQLLADFEDLEEGLVSVKPMEMPVGNLFYIDYKYGQPINKIEEKSPNKTQTSNERGRDPPILD